jgi:hypothetical protein
MLDRELSCFDIDFEAENYKSTFFENNKVVPPDVLKEQDKILEQLINEGSVHQYKKIRRNIGHIICEFHKKDCRPVKLKQVIELLEKSINIYKAAGFIRNLSGG